MGRVPVAQPSPPGRNVRWSWRLGLAGLGLVASLGFAVAMLALFAWPHGGGAPEVPGLVEAGRVDDFPAGEPVRFEEHGFWLVRLESEEFLALSQRSPYLGCTVPWRPDFEFKGETGWFRDPCHSGTFDLLGRCFAPQCPRGMDRFQVRIEEGQVQVDVSNVILGPPLDFEAEPVNPP